MAPADFKLDYRPGIDGMRCFAVLAVMLFHLDARLLPGGFVGVDVFFVISGYLITSLIYGECRAGEFSLKRFYQRRIARIFPVLFAVTCAILLVGYFVYTTQDFTSTCALAIASVLSLANIKLMNQGDYFEVTADAQPFLHFWSLSVEEQFYLIFPILLIILLKMKLRKKGLLITLGALALMSLAACVYLTKSNPTWAFYLLPTRAWELLAGAVLAIIAAHSPDSKFQSTLWIPILGFLLIGGSMFAIEKSHPFPGYLAFFPVLGSLLLIGVSQKPTHLVEQILEHPIFVLIGKYSYSLYLWHWPIYCFVDYALYSDAAWMRVAAKIGLTIGCSLLSYQALERPLRSYLNRPERRTVSYLGFIGGALAIIATCGFLRAQYYNPSTTSNIAKGGTSYPAASGAPSIVLMGDSQGSMYGTMMKSLAKKEGYHLNVISSAGGNPWPGSQQYEDSIQFLENQKPDITIFTAGYTAKMSIMRRQIHPLLKDILAHSSHLIFLTQTPYLPENATREQFRKNGFEAIFEPPSYTKLRATAHRLLESMEGRRIHVVDAHSWFTREDGEIVFRDRFGKQFYQDRSHLSVRGTKMVQKKLEQKLRLILDAEAGTQ